jgi:hypothetical protein
MDSHEFEDTQNLQSLTTVSKVFVLLLTHDRNSHDDMKNGVHMRWFVVAHELFTAVREKKPILLLRDTDARPGRFGGSKEFFRDLFAQDTYNNGQKSVVAEANTNPNPH